MKNSRNIGMAYVTEFVCESRGLKAAKSRFCGVARKCRNLAAKFFWGLNQKSAPSFSAKCTLTHILKISDKYIEKCRRRSDLSEAHFGNIAKWDIIDFVHFWQFFWPIIHISAVIELEIDWEVYFSPTDHIKLASFENSDIWPSYRPKTIKFSGRTHIWA